jgi:lysophospholipase L1-like esterase
LPQTFRSLIAALFIITPALALQACGDNTPVTPTPPDNSTAPKLTCPSGASAVSPAGAPVSVVYPLPTVAGGLAPLVGPTCTPPTGSTFPAGSTNVTCTVTDAKARADICTFAVTVTVPPKLSASRFVAFGDSITWGEDGRNSASESVAGGQRLHVEVQFDTPNTYPGALQTELDTRYTSQLPSVDNAGLPNESVLGTNTLSRFVSRTSGFDVVLLMEGANDLPNASASSIAAGLGRMIDNARSRGVKPYLATIPPENASSQCIPGCRGSYAGLVPPLDDQIRLLAASKGVPLVDVFQAFHGDVLTLIGPDGLHPSAAGYHVIADTFFASIKQTLEISTPTTTSTSFRMPFVTAPRRR